MREITDMTGRKVMVPATINSVFAGSMYGYAILAALKPEIVAATVMPARDCDKNYLHPHLHNLPLIEKITETDALKNLKPDVVIVWADSNQPWHKKSEDILSAINLPFVYVTVANFGDISGFSEAFAFLGELLDCRERAGKLAEYCRQTCREIEALIARVAQEQRPAVYYAECDDGLATEFDDSLHAHLLKLLGDVNVHRGQLQNHKGMERITLEQLQQYEPDVIIAWSKSLCEKTGTDPDWAQIKAVKNRRVHPIPDVPFNWFDRPPCFMRVLGVKWLASLLYPNDYKIDLIKETRDFFALFLNKSISSQEAANIIARENELLPR